MTWKPDHNVVAIGNSNGYLWILKLKSFRYIYYLLSFVTSYSLCFGVGAFIY